MAKKKAEPIVIEKAPEVSASDIATKIFLVRKTIKNAQSEEKELVENLKTALQDETSVPGICEFKTYENTKVEWQKVAEALRILVPTDAYERAVKEYTNQSSMTKLLFEKDFSVADVAA